MTASPQRRTRRQQQMADRFPPFRGRVSVTLIEIAEQRKKGWPDFHPEDFCHRCGGRNFTWFIDSEAWNPVMRPEGEDAPWRWNEIICPACFAELFERIWPLTGFEFVVQEATIGGRAFRTSQDVAITASEGPQ